ncbi:MAG: aminoacyl-tRNA hydrolase [Thermodesulfatator sp.]|nr:MAG: aminoacyl-tRNA hydrolase [Thermodesulfatator sp.]
MKLIVGLGNPGERYRFSRHNFGFIVVDILADEWRIPLNQQGYFSLFGRGIFKGVELFLVKPMTYMNNSGVALKGWFEFILPSVEDVLVIHDDLDLPFGDVRLKKDGGHGGHRGLISIIEVTGTKNFSRLRIGTGRPQGRERDREAIIEWLLRPLSQDELLQLDKSFEKAKNCIEEFILYGIEKAMSNCNKKA